MRWADLDSLNHVNNVVYVDYAMEVRAKLGHHEPVRRATVDFLRPLLLSSKPVLVRSDVADDVETYEICGNDGSAVFARIALERGEPQPVVDEAGSELSIQLRRTDLGPDGAVTIGRLFELVQEVRIMGIGTTFPHREAGRFVVGRVQLDLGEPLTWSDEPYRVQTHVSHVSTSSFGSMTRFVGGRDGSALSILVGFDPATQSSRKLDGAEREALEAALR
jgi:acyl-CoA thioester hydrolase